MRSHKARLRLWGVGLLAFAAFMLALPSSYARYRTQVNGNGVVSAALWGSESEFSLPVDLTGLRPGETATVPLKITNRNQTGISEVDQEYSITLKSTGNLPLKFELSSDSSRSTGGGTIIPSQTLDATGGEAAAAGGILLHSTEAVHMYLLTVTWPETQAGGSTDAEYAGEIDMVTLTVSAQQSMPGGS